MQLFNAIIDKSKTTIHDKINVIYIPYNEVIRANYLIDQEHLNRLPHTDIKKPEQNRMVDEHIIKIIPNSFHES